MYKIERDTKTSNLVTVIRENENVSVNEQLEELRSKFYPEVIIFKFSQGNDM